MKYAYVVVDRVGKASGFDNADEALDYMYTCIGGAWHVFAERHRGIAYDLITQGYCQFEYCTADSQDIHAAIYRNDECMDTSWYTNQHVDPDSVSGKYIAEAIKSWTARDGIRQGDFLLEGDELNRLTVIWKGKAVQGCVASFYMGRNAGTTCSGTMHEPVNMDQIRDTGNTCDGDFWFFKDDIIGGHRGLYFQAPCRVYERTDL